jgi:hypothetical protein
MLESSRVSLTGGHAGILAGGLWIYIALAILSGTAIPSTLLSSAHAAGEAVTKAADAQPLELTVDASAVGRAFSPRRLGGTNIALWNDKFQFANQDVLRWMIDLKPAYIRLPGGSWANAVYWNGNGVRGSDGKVDPSKVGPDGYPAVDYSAYAPSFTVDDKTLRPSTGFPGNVDVRTLHEWIRKIPDAEPLVCLNAGTGRPIDAAEWVKWANFTTRNHAKYWEIGNELDGSWEPGYTLPDGSRITPAIYVGRFNAIASAMKAVDPTIKVGGCAFAEPMIRECGSNVDFVSIHTYPGTLTLSPQENLQAIPKIVKKEVGKVRDWIRKYQPGRESAIEVAYTEWNLAGGQNASDLFSGLWACTFLAEAARNGVDFTTQWDVFTHVKGMKSGHGLFFTDGQTYIRKPSYYAMWMWNNRTGDHILDVSGGEDSVYRFASRDKQSVYVMLINPDDTRVRQVRLNVKGLTTASVAQTITLSGRNYFWNPLTLYPDWSVPPQPETVDVVAGSLTVTLPPFSATFVTVPAEGASSAHAAEPGSAAEAKAKATPPGALRLIVPTTVYAGDQVTGWVQSVENAGPATRPARVAGLTAEMSGEGGITFASPSVDLSEAVAAFSFRADRVGTQTLHAKAGDVSASATVEVKSSEPRPRVFWDFTDRSLVEGKLFESDFKLIPDESLRANKMVARVDLPEGGIVPTEKGNHRTLLRVNRFPEASSLNRDNIRGVVFDAKALNLHSDDPSAAVQVVLQSPANYWMILGSVPLTELGEKWSTREIVTRDPKHIKIMSSTYNLWLVLSSSKTVRGSICFDRIGFMAR